MQIMDLNRSRKGRKNYTLKPGEHFKTLHKYILKCIFFLFDNKTF